jgi:hypothetical protein
MATRESLVKSQVDSAEVESLLAQYRCVNEALVLESAVTHQLTVWSPAPSFAKFVLRLRLSAECR